MNEPIYLPSDRSGLAIVISPWNGRAPAAPAPFACQTTVSGLKIYCEHEIALAERFATFEALCRFALQLLSDVAQKVSCPSSGLTLDHAKFVKAVSGWTDTDVPVHALVAFDFAAPPVGGPVPGVVSHGLAALVGQEVVCWPEHENDRLLAARMTVRVVHDLLLNGPLSTSMSVRGPDGRPVALTLSTEPDEIVTITW